MMIRRTVPVLVALLLAGCGFFRRSELHMYSLQTIAPAGAAVAITGTPVGINGVELPPGIDRREIVVRDEDHRLDVRGTHMWAGPLEDMVIHTLAFNLANRLPEGMVVLPGHAKPPGTIRGIYLILEDLAPGPDRVFVLNGRWIVREAGRPEVTFHERITLQLDSLDSENVAAAMSQSLAQLADRIASQLGGA